MDSKCDIVQTNKLIWTVPPQNDWKIGFQKFQKFFSDYRVSFNVARIVLEMFLFNRVFFFQIV